MPKRPFSLAFIDPGIRKAPFFLDLRQHLAPDIRCLYYSQRMIVSGFVRSAGLELFPARRESVAPYSISDEELQRAVGKKELVLRGSKALRRARKVISTLSAFFDSQRIDAILVWNGSNLVVSMAVYLARRRGITVLFAEHGYLPGTTQIDCAGVNFEASISPLVHSGQAQRKADAEIDQALDHEIESYRSGRPMRVLSPVVPAHFRRDWRSHLARVVHAKASAAFFRFRASVGKRVEQLPERFVFLPFQVKKDSQLILHSPLMGNDMEGMVAAVHDSLARISPDTKIVVKFHPKEHPFTQMGYDRLVRKYPDVLFIHNHSVARLIEAAQAVVTVNSTVGFEAIVLGKPVVTLGLNFYTRQGLVETVSELAQLDDALSRALTLPPDAVERRAFLRYIYRDFLALGSYHDFSEPSFTAIADRIRTLLEVSRTPSWPISSSQHDQLALASGEMSFNHA